MVSVAPLPDAPSACSFKSRPAALHTAVAITFKGLLHVLCRIDAAALAKVPARGPLLIVANHINFLEVPLLYTHLLPRPITGFAKAETWNTWAGRTLMNLWNIIPLQRGEADLLALRRGLAALEAGMLLGVTPEGTRSGNGILRRAHPGIAWLALQSRAPILPLAYYGGEAFWRNLRRLRRTDFHIVVGEPLVLRSYERVDRHMRQVIADAIMAEVARLLPPAYRGVYADHPALATAEPAPCLERLYKHEVCGSRKIEEGLCYPG